MIEKNIVKKLEKRMLKRKVWKGGLNMRRGSKSAGDSLVSNGDW